MQSHHGRLNGDRRAFYLAFAVFVLAVFAVAALAPARAYAKSYTMPQVDITAEVQSDGSLHVVEQRTFDFDGSFTAVWWTHGALPENGALQVNGVSIADLGESGSAESAELQSISETPFNLDWRTAGGPGDTSYSVDAVENTTYVFFHATDTRLLVQYDYTVINGAQIYDDCAELYWKYVTEGWAVDSQNVTCTIALPVPGDVSPVVGEDVRAWGHGPLDGTLAFNDDASSIAYDVSNVSAGSFAEARVVFPVDWLSNASEEALVAHAGEERLDTVLSQEQGWADQANARRMRALALLAGLTLLTLALIVWAFIMFLRYGKEHKATFTDDYWRDVPHKGVHPAVIARLYRWNRSSNDDFTATIMHLAHEGYISINRGTYARPSSFGRQEQVADYYITRSSTKTLEGADVIDRKAIEFLFDTVGRHQNSIWLGSISQYGKSHARTFDSKMRSWQGQVSAAVGKMSYFEAKGSMLQSTMAMMGIGYAVAMFIAAFLMVNFWPVLFGVIGGVALFAISNFMPRRSQEGLDDYERSRALKRWLKDFSALNERVPLDVKVWGELMVYAYIFGVADEVIRQLRNVVPNLFVQDDAWAASNYGYVPWYCWYDHNDPVMRSSGMTSFGDAFNTAWSNTVQTAHNAVAAAEAAASGGSGGGWSSGGGFGGGFSGGGGGGFGGGGGGGAR